MKLRTMAIALRGLLLSTAGVFRSIHKRNQWHDSESVSGEGSSMDATAAIREQLPRIVSEYGICCMLDIPCGDGNWMSAVKLAGVEYIGADIVPELVECNAGQNSDPSRRFMTLDLIKDSLPRVDLVFCRDCLVHLTLRKAQAAVRNIRGSGARYLMATTFVDCEVNQYRATGMWKPLNMERPPFSFPSPLLLVNERDPSEPGKSMGLWRLADFE